MIVSLTPDKILCQFFFCNFSSSEYMAEIGYIKWQLDWPHNTHDGKLALVELEAHKHATMIPQLTRASNNYSKQTHKFHGSSE
jgi:hypothetical protein